MKLMFCTECHDVVALRHAERTCECGKCKGRYLDDGLHAVVEGPVIPLGYANRTFVFALKNQPEEGMGKEFTAFVIPRKCPTIHHSKDVPPAERHKAHKAK